MYLKASSAMSLTFNRFAAVLSPWPPWSSGLAPAVG